MIVIANTPHLEWVLLAILLPVLATGSGNGGSTECVRINRRANDRVGSGQAHGPSPRTNAVSSCDKAWKAGKGIRSGNRHDKSRSGSHQFSARPGRAPGQRVQLHRALSKLGLCSRSLAWSAIKKGRVQVNGKTTFDPLVWIDVEGTGSALIPMTD